MTPQRRRDRITGIINHVHLYLDDLREIEAIFRSVEGSDHIPGDEDTLSVTGPNYEASTVDELAEIEGDVVRDLSIRRHWPHMTLSVRAQGVYYSGDDSTDLQQRGAIEQVISIVNNAQRPALLRLLIHPWLAVVGGAIFMSSYTALLTGTVQVGIRYWVLGAILLGAAWIAVAYLMDMRFSAKATLVERSQAPSFFKRKRDDIILSIFSTLLGLVVGVVGTLIAQAIAP